MWTKQKDHHIYTPGEQHTENVNKLPAGHYTIHRTMFGTQAVKAQTKEEDLIYFENGCYKDIVEEIKLFWDLEPRYEQMGIPYRRGILMHGLPGTGKSGIISLLIKEIEKEGGISTNIGNASDLEWWCLTLNNVEKGRKVLYIIEDAEEIINDDEYSFLQILDGVQYSTPGAVFIATTNNIHEISPRVYRPSRFDLKIEVPPPSLEIREQYINTLTERMKVNYDQRIAAKSEGLTFAQMKEVVVSYYLFDKDLDTLVQRVQETYQDAN